MEQLSTREKARALASAVEIGDFSYWSSGSIESALAKYFNMEPGLVGYKIKEVFFHDNDDDCNGGHECSGTGHKG